MSAPAPARRRREGEARDLDGRLASAALKPAPMILPPPSLCTTTSSRGCCVPAVLRGVAGAQATRRDEGRGAAEQGAQSQCFGHHGRVCGVVRSEAAGFLAWLPRAIRLVLCSRLDTVLVRLQSCSSCGFWAQLMRCFAALLDAQLMARNQRVVRMPVDRRPVDTRARESIRVAALISGATSKNTATTLVDTPAGPHDSSSSPRTASAVELSDAQQPPQPPKLCHASTSAPGGRRALDNMPGAALRARTTYKTAATDKNAGDRHRPRGRAPRPLVDARRSLPDDKYGYKQLLHWAERRPRYRSRRQIECCPVPGSCLSTVARLLP